MNASNNIGRPERVFPTADQVPAELCELKRWVGFRFKWDGHKYKKPPHSPVDGTAIGAVPKYESHFLTFTDALAGAHKHQLDGVGFVFLQGDGLVGIDFDNCRTDGQINETVTTWLHWFPTYREVSPSGTGVHAIASGKLARALAATSIEPGSESKVEMYSFDRFFTFTGQALPDSRGQVLDCQAGIDKLLDHLGEKNDDSGTAPSASRRGKPLPASLVRHFHAEDLALLRNASEGEGNSLLNKVAFNTARYYKTGVLQRTEKELRDELLHIVTKEWSTPHEERGAQGTINSGWAKGLEADAPFISNKDAIRFLPGDLETAIAASEGVLYGIGLKYFVRDGRLVHTVYGRDTDKDNQIKGRDSNSIIIQTASNATLTRDLDKHAQFYTSVKQNKQTEEWQASYIHVPHEIPTQIHDRVKTQAREVPYPTLDMVTSSPVVLPSGQVTSVERRFAEGVLFTPRDHKSYPTLLPRPGRDDARAGIQALLAHIFGKFPFKDEESKSVVLSGILTLVSRPYLSFGPVPLHTFHATTARSGKTRLAKAICAAALGHLPTTVGFRDEEEFDKALLPIMLAADRAVLIDNVERTLQGSKLNILLTENIMEDRILGKSEKVRLRNIGVFFATGNQLTLGGDLTTRALRCDIDAQMEHPEERKFDFDPVDRALQEHPRWVTAACLALRAYLLAGAPFGLERNNWGGFEDWDRLICGCLVWLGFADPYLTRKRVIESDPIRETNSDLIDAWVKKYGNRETSLAQIHKDGGDVCEALLDKNQWNGHHARWVLRRLVGRIINGHRLERCEGRSVFCVRSVNGQAKLPGL